MAKREFQPGLGSKALKKKDEKKGQYYKSPGSRISYIKQGVMRVFIPKEGKNRLRIIQPFELAALGFYGLEMSFHRNVGDEGEELHGDYLCNERMKILLEIATRT